MIDFGLSELMLIGVVALIVLGPERLPGVARMAGSVFGRAQRYVHQLRSEVNNELALDDLHSLRNEVRDTASEVENAFSRDTLFSGSTRDTEEIGPDHELAAAKAKTFRNRKTEIRAHASSRHGRPARKKLTSSAAQHARNQSMNPSRRGAP